MRILYLDLDSTRPDHLGCYGYHRDTSPNIDRLAREALRFNNCYCSDAPCLPSRTALYCGRHGFVNGVVNHGGLRSQPYPDGPDRGFRDVFRNTSWPAALREAGYYTAACSPFGERHSAWHWYAGFNEIINPGKGGNDIADDVSPPVLDWLKHHGAKEKWFLHVNLWDPHIPYRTPEAFGNPFADDPLPDWPTEETRQRDWNRPGQHSPQEVIGFRDNPNWVNRPTYQRQPLQLRNMEDVRQQIDGYDVGIRYADEHVGRILNFLADQGLLDDTAVIVSADHGECFGEMGVWGDHQTADQVTCQLPLIFRWPGITPALSATPADGLVYHFDFAATAIELAGGSVPGNWHGTSFAEHLNSGNPGAIGRDQLVLSQGAHVCQRSVRRGQHLYIRTYHDGYHDFPQNLLYNLADDPHEENDLAETETQTLEDARSRLDAWTDAMREQNPNQEDPFDTVIAEGGPFHSKPAIPDYVQRLRQTGREHAANLLESRHPGVFH